MDHTRTEIAAGAFVLVGLAALGVLSVSVAGLRLAPAGRYALHARFASIGDLKPGARVTVAGVPVGEVGRIALVRYTADVTLRIDRDLHLPADTIASIRSVGLLGESYVALAPGGEERMLADGDRIAQTQPAIDIIDLIGRYAFSGGRGGGAAEPEPGATPGGGPLDPDADPGKGPPRPGSNH